MPPFYRLDGAGATMDLEQLRVEYSPDCEGHLRALSARERAIVLDAVDEQLVHEPTVETRNRKPMRPNPVAPWELRIGDLRVYYDVIDSPEAVVHVPAVGVKERDVVRIGGEVVRL
jgi:mRNA-degrading endonuclease RelE of RelBE toxin-antitoxin system